MRKEEILKKITEKFLGSEEFNGFPLFDLGNHKEKIMELIKDGKIDINFGNNHPNVHIKAFELDKIPIQLEKIKNITLNNCCAYPSKKHLKQKVSSGKFREKPFTRKIALGEPTLNFAVFDLSVLEAYRNDPRYSYSTNEIGGNIFISNKYYNSLDMKSSDKILLQTFGFCYEKGSLNRAVAVFYRYLANLTPEHQKIWHGKILPDNYLLHPDYARISMGHWPEKESLFTAFIEELHVINEFSKLMGRPTLFNSDYKEKKPREFGFLIRPTKKEFNSFIHLLDKMISDNINKDFFMNEIEYKIENEREDGKIEIINKGTLTILKDWIDKKIKFLDPIPKDKMIKTFRKIRKMRQPEAHNVNDDIFDQKYYHIQKELMLEAYQAVRTLRLMLANHRKTKQYEVPDWLYKGEIWNF